MEDRYGIEMDPSEADKYRERWEEIRILSNKMTIESVDLEEGLKPGKEVWGVVITDGTSKKPFVVFKSQGNKEMESNWFDSIDANEYCRVVVSIVVLYGAQDALNFIKLHTNYCHTDSLGQCINPLRCSKFHLTKGLRGFLRRACEKKEQRLKMSKAKWAQEGKMDAVTRALQWNEEACINGKALVMRLQMGIKLAQDLTLSDITTEFMMQSALVDQGVQFRHQVNTQKIRIGEYGVSLYEVERIQKAIQLNLFDFNCP